MPSASLALPSAATLTAPPTLFAPASYAVSFPIQYVVIDWDRLIAKRPLVLATVDTMPSYLLKPEVLVLKERVRRTPYSQARRKSRGRTVQYYGAYLSAFVCDSFITARAAVKNCVAIIGASLDREYRDLYPCAHR